jgi:HTH-type transcriptional regulator, sugar sensing transcriptional regulator
MLPFMTHTPEELSKTLSSLGLSEKEAAVYLAILEMGRGTVTEISRKANINRTSGYDILDSLSAQGLVRVSGKEPKQEYVAESPDNLVALLEKKLRDTEEQLRAARSFVPTLKGIHRVEDRPQVKFYEGSDGLRQVYEDTLTSHEQILAYATVDDMHKGLPNYFPEYYKRRADKGISIRAIVPETEAGRERMSHDAEEKREIAFVPADKYYFSPEINIYDNKVMVASWREKLGIIIESAEIADAMKKIYELAWTGAKQTVDAATKTA